MTPSPCKSWQLGTILRPSNEMSVDRVFFPSKRWLWNGPWAGFRWSSGFDEGMLDGRKVFLNLSVEFTKEVFGSAEINIMWWSWDNFGSIRNSRSLTCVSKGWYTNLHSREDKNSLLQFTHIKISQLFYTWKYSD